MFIIAGLGNPERKYNGTRHNIGFSAVTTISDEYNRAESNTCPATDLYEFKW